MNAKLPGNPSVWVLITLEMAVFLLYFVVFTSGRIEKPAMFEQGRQQLNSVLGFANTLILLTSSWFVVQAVKAAREQIADLVKRYLLLAMLCGATFGVLKIVGYCGDALAGYSITTNMFFGYYFVITGLHFLHVLVGLMVLIICYFKARHGSINNQFLVWIESGGCFWHMVDMLWVFIFPMLYLLRVV
ncbi:MAG: cytochrome c oxidase subunit 3 [Negativicutes bacterium]